MRLTRRAHRHAAVLLDDDCDDSYARPWLRFHSMRRRLSQDCAIVTGQNGSNWRKKGEEQACWLMLHHIGLIEARSLGRVVPNGRDRTVAKGCSGWQKPRKRSSTAAFLAVAMFSVAIVSSVGLNHCDGITKGERIRLFLGRCEELARCQLYFEYFVLSHWHIALLAHVYAAVCAAHLDATKLVRIVTMSKRSTRGCGSAVPCYFERGDRPGPGRNSEEPSQSIEVPDWTIIQQHGGKMPNGVESGTPECRWQCG